MSHAPRLQRRLTLVPTTAILITNVIGTGVFLKARVMTCNVGSPWLVLLAYALGGVFTVAGALSMAELSTMLPKAGGPYNYIGAAFGRPWAFLYGWMEALIDGGASLAALAIAIATFLPLGGALDTATLRLIAIGTLAFTVGIALLSMAANGAIAAVVTGLKVALVIGVGVAALVFGDGAWGNFAGSGAAGACENVPEAARAGLSGFGAAMIGALWSYNGWTALSFVAGEVRSPERTLVRAFLYGSCILAALYIFVNVGYFYILTPLEIASVPENGAVAQEALVRIVGNVGAAIIAMGLALSSFGALHSGVVAIAGVPYAMAKDRLLPAALGRVSPRTHMPVVASVTLGLLSVLFVLSGSFEILTDLAIFVLLFFTGLAVAAVYALRRKLPNAPRPYRVWGYPVLPALFLLATAFLMINTLLTTPGRALAGIGIVLTGLPVYWWYARKLPPDRPESWLEGSHDGSIT